MPSTRDKPVISPGNAQKRITQHEAHIAAAGPAGRAPSSRLSTRESAALVPAGIVERPTAQHEAHIAAAAPHQRPATSGQVTRKSATATPAAAQPVSVASQVTSYDRGRSSSTSSLPTTTPPGSNRVPTAAEIRTNKKAADVREGKSFYTQTKASAARAIRDTHALPQFIKDTLIPQKRRETLLGSTTLAKFFGGKTWSHEGIAEAEKAKKFGSITRTVAQALYHAENARSDEEKAAIGKADSAQKRGETLSNTADNTEAAGALAGFATTAATGNLIAGASISVGANLLAAGSRVAAAGEHEQAKDQFQSATDLARIEFGARAFLASGQDREALRKEYEQEPGRTTGDSRLEVNGVEQDSPEFRQRRAEFNKEVLTPQDTSRTRALAQTAKAQGTEAAHQRLKGALNVTKAVIATTGYSDLPGTTELAQGIVGQDKGAGKRFVEAGLDEIEGKVQDATVSVAEDKKRSWFGRRENTKSGALFAGKRDSDEARAKLEMALHQRAVIAAETIQKSPRFKAVYRRGQTNDDR